MSIEVDISELELPRMVFYAYQPSADLGLHRDRQLGPMLCGIGLRPLVQIAFHIIDQNNRHVALPAGTIKLPPNKAAAQLALELRGRCMDGRRLRQSACAASLRAWLPTVSRLSRLQAPLAHAAPVAIAVGHILGLMLKAGEIRPVSHTIAA